MPCTILLSCYPFYIPTNTGITTMKTIGKIILASSFALTVATGIAIANELKVFSKDCEEYRDAAITFMGSSLYNVMSEDEALEVAKLSGDSTIVEIATMSYKVSPMPSVYLNDLLIASFATRIYNECKR